MQFLYVKLLHNREDDLMHQKGWKSYRVWLAMVAGSWVVAWLIAETVPIFSDLVNLTGALFASWFTFGFSGMFWFQINWERKNWFRQWMQATPRKRLLFLVNLGNIIVALALFGVGTYTSVLGMIDNGKEGKTTKPFSC
jgi:hypothetical protein